MNQNLTVDTGTDHEDTFDTAMRGYHRGQVQDYVAHANQRLATLEQQLAVARADAEQARSEADQANREVERLGAVAAETKPAHQAVSDRLSEILRLAAEEADQERETAEAEIAAMHRAAEEQAAQVLADANAEVEQLVGRARQAAESDLESARETAERELGEARNEADRLRLAAVRQTQELLDEAQRRADAVNEISGQRLETLTATHDEAVLRLGQIRDVLADLLQSDEATGSLASVVDEAVASAAPVPAGPLHEGLLDDPELQAVIENADELDASAPPEEVELADAEPDDPAAPEEAELEDAELLPVAEKDPREERRAEAKLSRRR